MELLKEIADAEGDAVRLFKKVDSNGVERLFVELEIDVTKEWIRKYTGVYRLAETIKIKSNEIYFPDPIEKYGRKTFTEKEVNDLLAIFKDGESIITQYDKADILRHQLLTIP